MRNRLFLFLALLAQALAEDVWIVDTNIVRRDTHDLLPEVLHLTIRREIGREHHLRLEENKRLNADAPIYEPKLVNGKTTVVAKQGSALKNVKFYHDKNNMASIKVAKGPFNQFQNHVEGELVLDGENFFISPSARSRHARETTAGAGVRHTIRKVEPMDYLSGDYLPGHIREALEDRRKRQAGERSERSTSPQQYVIETIMSVDHVLWDRFMNITVPQNGESKETAVENELRQQLTLVLNGVSLAFEAIDDPEFKIFCVISGFYFVKQLTPDNPLSKFPVRSGNLAVTLDYFNALVDHIQQLTIPHDDHYMFFTWFNLPDAVGLATVGNVCYRSRMSVSQFSTPESNRARGCHELGHNMGAHHDDKAGCTQGWWVMWGASYRFSSCSVDYFRNFLKEWGGKCLLDYTDQTEINDRNNRLPGVRYSLEDQCKLFAGEDSTICSQKVPPAHPDFCKFGVCSYEGACNINVTFSDGSRCGRPYEDKWCIKEQCVLKSGTEITPTPAGDQTQCFDVRYSHLYKGTVSTTKSGAPCQRWDSQSPHKHGLNLASLFPDSSVTEAENYCRSPDDSGTPWCFLAEYWALCDIPKCSAEKQKVCEDYLHTQTTTKSGLTCQRWDSQTPHSHRFTDPSAFPDATLADAGNFCRDPDGSGGPWCYTTSADKRWEFCGSSAPACQSDECFSAIIEYIGTKNTARGVPCQSWTSKSPHYNHFTASTKFPEGSAQAASNYCRNPDNEAGPWCYLSKEFDTCDVLPCPESIVQTKECYYPDHSQKYIGSVSTTKTGATCQRWDSQSPHQHSENVASMFPDQSVGDAANFCRDPNNSGTPWCYLANRWAYCDIPKCSDEQQKACLAYQSTLTTTRSGLTCQRWDSQTPHSHKYTDPNAFPDATLADAGNFCRDPDGSGGAWCYTTSTDKRWEFCGSSSPACKSDECYTNVIEYTGTKNTVLGIPCQPWTLSSPHYNYYTTSTKFPEGSAQAASNYCRNPDNDSGPWCYLSKVSDTCEVPQC